MDALDLAPVAMTAGGDALARDEDGRVVFVEGALPGERVRAEVIRSKKDFAKARVIEVLEASPDRVAPPCAARAAGCGGCSWQHVRPSAQGALKVEIVRDALRRIARLDPAAVPVALRPVPEGWPRPRRTTVRLGVGLDGRAGERRGGAHDVVAADACLAVHPLLEELVVAGRFPGASEVVLRVGTVSGDRAVSVEPSGVSGAAIVPADVQVGPAAVVHEDVAGAHLQVSMGSFFQSGPEVAAALVEAVDDGVGDRLVAGGHLLDAYAGVGLFGATIGARRRAFVTAVETSRSAVADAKVNLLAAGVAGRRVVRAEVGAYRGAGDVDVVVADPARSGLGRPGVGAIEASGADRLVLVSCDPASLARDAVLLEGIGFRCRRVDLVDAFPDTFHVETVTVFDR